MKVLILSKTDSFLRSSDVQYVCLTNDDQPTRKLVEEVGMKASCVGMEMRWIHLDGSSIQGCLTYLDDVLEEIEKREGKEVSDG